jgi:hypothetical protein
MLIATSTRAGIVLCALALSASAQAATDYALYLPLNGNMVDASPNMNNGTATGACSFSAGETGDALTLDGTSCFVALKSVINEQPSWTWQAWVYPTSNGGEIYGEGGPDATFQVVNLGNGTLGLESWNTSYPGNWIGFNVPGVLPLNQWTLVTLTLEDAGVGVGTVKVYINKSFVTQGAFQMESAPGATYAGIGDNPGDHGGGQGSDYFGGKVEELQIFERALAPSEICATPNILCGATCLASTSCCTNEDCPGPSEGNGTGVCSGPGGSCSITCGNSETLCNGACIGETKCCNGICPPNDCIQNPSCDPSGTCVGDPVPDGTQCSIAGCPGVSSCVSATCTCQIPADLGPSDPAMADGGSQPVKHSRGCTITGVGERGANASFCFLALVVALAAARRRRLA